MFYTEWAKSRYTVIIFFKGIVNDGRELKYTTKKVIVYTVYYILYTYFWPTLYLKTLTGRGKLRHTRVSDTKR